jgi:hypothetical protein
VSNYELLPIVNDALIILRRIKLRINPRDNPDKIQDDALLSSLADLVEPQKLDPRHFLTSWEQLADGAVEQAREILKREWEVAKHPRLSRLRRRCGRVKQYLVSAVHQAKTRATKY